MIKITVVSYNSEPPASPVSALFGEEPASIGRSDDNFLVLPDPRHFVSRAQAKAWSDGAQHKLINISRANPILINGQEIEAEREYDIHAGDNIQIGLYLLSVGHPDAADIATAAATATTTAGAAKKAPVPAAKTTPAPPQFLLRPDDTQVKVDTVSSSGSLANLGSPDSPAQQPTIPAMPPTPPIPAAFAPVATPPSEASKTDAGDLLQAFLNGAGLPELSLSSGLTSELMETMGKLVASSVQGTMELISQRALVKREVNAEVTMVVLRKNNPLKFFPDSETVLTQMLRKKMPGFMTPAEAMEDAFLDLRAHQLGVIAGMKATRDALLKQLQPASFEHELSAPTLLDHLNPARRKAAMWQHFSERFAGISSESKDEFQSIFGKEFLLAYEEEIERVKHGSPAG